MSSTETAGYVALNERPQGGHAKLLALIGSGKRVLRIGCSSGYLARTLVERGCTVVGIEQDEKAAQAARVVCAEVRGWRYTERRILSRTHLRVFTRKTHVEAIGHSGYRVVELDLTVPVPGVKTPSVEPRLARDRPAAASTPRVPVRRSGDAALT